MRQFAAGLLMVIADDLYRLADWLDPVEPEVPFDVDEWPNMGWVDDTGVTLADDPWVKAIEDQHKITIPPLPYVKLRVDREHLDFNPPTSADYKDLRHPLAGGEIGRAGE